MGFHDDLTGLDIHVIHAFTFADAAARTGATGFVAADVGKVAKQTDDDSYWILTVITPVWQQLADPDLSDIAALTPTDGNFIVGNGTNWVAESGATARASLGLTIGTDVQAFDAELAALAGLTSAADKLPYFTGVGTAAVTDFTAFARTILDDADAPTVRTTIGLGTMATQNANAVAITGGAIDGTTIGTTTASTGTFTQITVNAANADLDSVFHGTSSNLLYLDAGNNRIGILTAAPSELVHLKQDQNGQTALRIENATSGVNAASDIVLIESGLKFFFFRYRNTGADGSLMTSIANSGVIGSGSGAVGGLILGTSAAAPIRFYAGGEALTDELMQVDPTKGLDVFKRFGTRANSPAQITSNQNDYDVGDTAFARLNTDASRNITGLDKGTDGRRLTISNVGSFNIVLKHQDAGSLAANRIIVSDGNDITLSPEDNLFLRYDSTTARWRANSSVAGGDFMDGGESTGAARTLGNNDAFALGLLTSGAQRIFIDAAGLVGINQIVPTAQFEIVNSTAGNVGFLLKEAAGQSANLFEWLDKEALL